MAKHRERREREKRLAAENAELRRRVAGLECECEKRQREIERLNRLVEQQRAEIERLRELARQKERAGHRQAAPFRRRRRKEDPEKPGRKAGQGPFRSRAMPTPTVAPIDVPMPTTCSRCGGHDLEYLDTETPTITDLPAIPQPIVTLYRRPVCRCACGHIERGRHLDLADDQFGASSHRFGRNVFVIAHLLTYGVGVPVNRMPAIFGELFGITITQGTLTRDALRRAVREVGAAADEIRECIRSAEIVHCDPTGWRTDGTSAQASVYAALDDGEKSAVYYEIAPHFTAADVARVLDADSFTGTLVTDRGKVFDAALLAGINQHKCTAHMRRNVKDVLERQRFGARTFGLGIIRLLDESEALWRDHRDGRIDRRDYDARAGPLHEAWATLLRPRVLTDIDNQRLLDGFGAQFAADRLMLFLLDPAIPPTNNTAERDLRPLVIARKVSFGSRTQRGADCRASFKTVIETGLARGTSARATLMALPTR